MQITIEGASLYAIEEKIIATARDIEERRLLLAEGCTCDLSTPKDVRRTADGMLISTPMRCSEAFVVCESRATRRTHGAPPMQSGSVEVDDLAKKMDALIKAHGEAKANGSPVVTVTS